MQSEWEIVKLGDCCSKIGSGSTPRGGSNIYLNSGEFALIRSQNILNNAFSNNGLVYIDKEEADKLKNVSVEKYDVLLNITGDSVARVCRTPYEYLPARVNQHVAIIRTKQDALDSSYLNYYLNSFGMKNYMLSLASAGATRNALTKGMIENFEIVKPPLPTQKKIAHILSTLDDKIELNRKMNQTLEAMAQALFKSWFVDFDPVHVKLTCKSDEELEVAARELGISKEVLELFPSEFEESELGMIPKGWEIRNFKDLVEKYIDNRGKTPPIENEGIPLLEVRTLPTTMLVSDYKTDKYVSDETYKTWFRSHLETDDILISTVGTIGLTCIVPDNSKFTIAQNVLGIRFNDKLLFKKYMFYMMKSKYFLDAINARLVTTVQSSIKRKDIETIDIVLAPLVIQNKFIELITSMMSIMQSNEIQTLQKTRDTLLPKLLSGELDVSEIEID
jgi:type I restriction enzyme S subunit